MSTIDQLETRTRLLLQETTANEWTQAQLFERINDAHEFLAAKMRVIFNSGWFSATQTFTVAASTETYDLSGLTRLFTSIKSLWHTRSDGSEKRIEALDEADINLSRLAGITVNADVEPGYFLLRAGGTNNLHLLPLAGATRTFRIYHGYQPPVLTTSQNLHTPPRYDDIVAKRAAWLALMDEGEDDPSITAYINLRLVEMQEFEGSAASESSPRAMRDEVTGVWFES